MPSEKIYENKVKRYLESQGIYKLGTPRDKMGAEPVGYYEKRWGSGITTSGAPDMRICIHGHVLEVELKAENGRVSDIQIFMITQINNAGGTAIVLRPSGFGEFKKLIENYL